MCAKLLLPYGSENVGGAAAAAQVLDDVVEVDIDRPLAKKQRANGKSGDGAEPNWPLAARLFEQDKAIEVTITGFNKGGLLTDWGGLPGFLPASQLEDFPECHLPSKRLEALSEWVERSVVVKIIELEEAANRLILSERAASISADSRTRLLNRLKVGERLDGRVTNLAAFGVFVDLGGVEGLIHISELSWGRVVDPGDVLRPGERVEVVVLDVEREVERIALSRKRLLPNPWEGVEARYAPEQRVEGVITNIAEFGAFVEVEEGLEGLIHVSEITDLPFSSPGEMLEVGEHVLARVLLVDGEERRLALSLK